MDCGTETACASGGRRLRADSSYGPGPGHGGNHAPIKLHGDGTLQQGNADDHPPGVLELNQNPLKPAQRAVFDANILAAAQEWPWANRQPGGKHRPNGCDLCVSHRGGSSTEANHGSYARRSQDRGLPARVETAEDVAGKQRQFQFLDPIRPGAPVSIKRQELFHFSSIRRSL
jgi:hypothetical protein